MMNEAFNLLQEGVASAEDIDKAIKLGTNMPMGPFELADYTGLDIGLDVMEVLFRETGDPKFRPSTLLRKYVRAGRLGRKSGRGVYNYTGTGPSIRASATLDLAPWITVEGGPRGPWAPAAASAGATAASPAWAASGGGPRTAR